MTFSPARGGRRLGISALQPVAIPGTFRAALMAVAVWGKTFDI